MIIQPGNNKIEKSVLEGTERSNRGSEIFKRKFNNHKTIHNIFEGHVDAHKCHINECTDIHQADLNTITTKEVAGYVATTFKNVNDLVTAIITLEIPVMVQPKQLRGDIGKRY